jgi:uncharacterized protein (TIGR03435 family)
VLNRFFEECGNASPAPGEIKPVLDRVWERLEWTAEEFVGMRAPAGPARSFRFVWAMGIVLATALVTALVGRHVPPPPLAVKTAIGSGHSLLRSSSRQAGEALQIAVPQDVFELASVNLLSPNSDAAKSASTEETMQLTFTGCSGGYIGRAQLDPGRVTFPGITVLSLVIIAYGQDCTLVEGGPAWARSGEYYEIQALLPSGTPRYTREDLLQGNAPRLQRMLQNLLADRYRLVLKREIREMTVYTLTVASPGKMTLSPGDKRTAPAGFPSLPGIPTPQLGRGQTLQFMQPSGDVQMSGHAISMSALSRNLRRYAGRIVVDKTGLNGVFDVDLKFASDLAPSTAAIPPTPPQAIPPLPGAPPSEPSLRIALEEQLGLKLESARMPIEVLVIESVERPTEN